MCIPHSHCCETEEGNKRANERNEKLKKKKRKQWSLLSLFHFCIRLSCVDDTNFSASKVTHSIEADCGDGNTILSRKMIGLAARSSTVACHFDGIRAVFIVDGYRTGAYLPPVSVSPYIHNAAAVYSIHKTIPADGLCPQ